MYLKSKFKYYLVENKAVDFIMIYEKVKCYNLNICCMCKKF